MNLQWTRIEVKENSEMRVGVDERSLVIEAMATLAYRKSDMVNFTLKPAGVPTEIYVPLSNQRDDLTGRRITKRQAAPLILDALEQRDDYADVIGNIVEIAANWERFELGDKEYDARAVKAKAQGILERHHRFSAEEAAPQGHCEAGARQRVSYCKEAGARSSTGDVR